MERSKNKNVNALGEEESSVMDTSTSLSNDLKNLDKFLAPFFAIPKEDHAKKLSAIDQAKVSIMEAYAINALFYVYLKTQGIDPSTHAVKEELDRVKLYVKKLQDLVDRDKKATLTLNVGAANRFINHALASPMSNGKQEISDTAGQTNSTQQKSVETKLKDSQPSKKKVEEIELDNSDEESATVSKTKKEKRKNPSISGQTKKDNSNQSKESSSQESKKKRK